MERQWSHLCNATHLNWEKMKRWQKNSESRPVHRERGRERERKRTQAVMSRWLACHGKGAELANGWGADVHLFWHSLSTLTQKTHDNTWLSAFLRIDKPSSLWLRLIPVVLKTTVLYVAEFPPLDVRRERQVTSHPATENDVNYCCDGWFFKIFFKSPALLICSCSFTQGFWWAIKAEISEADTKTNKRLCQSGYYDSYALKSDFISGWTAQQHKWSRFFILFN